MYFIKLLEERFPKQKQCRAKESQLFNAESTHRLLQAHKATISDNLLFPAMKGSEFSFGRSIANVKVNRKLSSSD